MHGSFEYMSRHIFCFLVPDFFEQFQIGESKLEQYIRDNQPSEKNTSLAKTKLQESEVLLMKIAHGKNKVSLVLLVAVDCSSLNTITVSKFLNQYELAHI